MLESKHGVLRSIFLRLRSADESFDKRVHVAMTFGISNQLYGSDVMSAYELSYGFTEPILHHPLPLPNNLLDAQDLLEAKRKLTRILRFKSRTQSAVTSDDMVEIFIKRPNSKRGSWSSPRVLLDVNYENSSTTVPDSRGHSVKAAFEDVRPAIDEHCFAQAIRDANGTLDKEIDDHLDTLPTDSDSQSKSTVNSMTNTRFFTKTEHSFEPRYNSDEHIVQPTDMSNENLAENETALSSLQPSTGDKIKFYWPRDNEYYPGIIAEEQDGNHTFVYDDGAIETLDFRNETWRFASKPNLLAISAFFLSRKSDMPRILAFMYEFFGNKPFLRYQAQAFPEYAPLSEYQIEEDDFRHTVKTIPLLKFQSIPILLQATPSLRLRSMMVKH